MILVAVVVIDGARAADEHALQTLGADAAFQTALGFFNHLRFGERRFDFGEVALALVGGSLDRNRARRLRLAQHQLLQLNRLELGFRQSLQDLD